MVWVSKSETATTFNHPLVVCVDFTFVLGFYSTCFCSVKYLYYLLNVILRFLKESFSEENLYYFQFHLYATFFKKYSGFRPFRILIYLVFSGLQCRTQFFISVSLSLTKDDFIAKCRFFFLINYQSFADINCCDQSIYSTYKIMLF